MKLGSKEDAKLIYRRRRSGAGPMPKGWKLLGAGAYRTCYLSPDGVVYKVHRQDGEWNSSEFDNYKRIRSSRVRLPKGWRIAKAKMYSFEHNDEPVDVIAMQYVEGKHYAMEEIDIDIDDFLEKVGATAAFEACGIWDVHEGNFVVTPTGKNVIVDLGE